MPNAIQTPTRARPEHRAPLTTSSRPRDTALARDGAPILPQGLIDAVDAAVEESFARTSSTDPLIPKAIATIRGPLDSVVRRHGLLIETAIATALEMSGSIEVMVQVAVPVSEAAIQLCLANTPDRTADLTMPIGSSIVRTPVLDIVAYFPDTGRLVVSSVKRGGGAQGGSAARQDRVELRAAAMILRGMLRNRGRAVETVEVITIDYYGRSGIAAGTVVTGAELDSFFGVPVAGLVEAMTARMAKAVEKRIAERVAALKRPGAAAGAGPVAGAVSVEAGAGAVLAFPPNGRGAPPTLAECFSALPLRSQGRQMAAVGAADHAAMRLTPR